MRLDHLPRGVTGFDRPAGVRPVPASRFKAACHAVARHTRREVVAFEGCGGKVEPNYHAATLEGPGAAGVSVLCNWCYPLLAFVPAGGYGFRKLAFLPPGEVGRAFAEWTEFQPLDPEFLEGALGPETLRHLGGGEIRQLRYWQRDSWAGRVGDVVFNAWD